MIAPILVLTARDAVGARVAALDRGADDYLVKPFAFEELIARLRALMRRASAPRWGPLSFGDLRVDPQSPIVWVGPRTVALSPREHAVLYRLVRRARDLTSRREILAEVFGYDFDPGTNVVEVHIAHLRRKLEGASAQIETVRGAGYRLRVPSEQDHERPGLTAQPTCTSLDRGWCCTRARAARAVWRNSSRSGSGCRRR